MENSPNDMVMGRLCRHVMGKSIKPEGSGISTVVQLTIVSVGDQDPTGDAPAGTANGLANVIVASFVDDES